VRRQITTRRIPYPILSFIFIRVVPQVNLRLLFTARRQKADVIVEADFIDRRNVGAKDVAPERRVQLTVVEIDLC